MAYVEWTFAGARDESRQVGTKLFSVEYLCQNTTDKSSDTRMKTFTYGLSQYIHENRNIKHIFVTPKILSTMINYENNGIDTKLK